MVLSLLFICVLAVELFQVFGKDYLLGTNRRMALEATVRQSYADLQDVRQRIDAARTALLAAIEQAEGERARRLDADRAFKQSQKTLPNLIHVLGENGGPMRFRAPLAKRLPPKPEPPQELIWSCKNFVEVWAGDVETARQTAVRQFSARHHYDIGEFTALPRPEIVHQDERAA